jgi:hypothetical protein
MAGTLERPLSVEERLLKVRTLIQIGVDGVEAADRAETELAIRRKAATACETAFHALVVLSDILIERAGRDPAESHSSRVEALEDIGRQDLANVYSRAMHALHIDGYYAQRFGRLQRDRLRELATSVERELAKLA